MPDNQNPAWGSSNFNNPPRPTPPSWGGSQPEDIFAKVEPPAAAPQPAAWQSSDRPRASGLPPTDNLPTAPVSGNNLKYLLIGVTTLLVLLAGGIYAYQVFIKPQFSEVVTPVVEQSTVAPSNELTVPAENTEVPSTAASEIMATTTEATSSSADLAADAVNTEAAVGIDSDGDGLSDIDEEQIGTDKMAIDTDNDGLNDREEIKLYNTDPLNPDTDGDTYQDGQEVRSGYNPAGAGRLLIVK